MRQCFDRIAGVGGVVILIKILTIFLTILLTLHIWFEKKRQKRDEVDNEFKEQKPTSEESIPSKGSTPEKEPLSSKEDSMDEKQMPEV